MKGAMPAPGPTMTTGTDGSSGKWKECAARGEMDIWNIRTTVVSVKDTPDASADPLASAEEIEAASLTQH